MSGGGVPSGPREPARLIRHPAGITTVDARYVRPGFASLHLIERQGRVAVVDTGTNDSVPEALDALDQLGLERTAVEIVFVTHVHLDHAGGAGRLLGELPNARVIAHPRAERHLIDPRKLAAASAAVYGRDVFDRLYGTLLPIAPERVVTSRDGQRIALGSSTLEILHTPGHALHHHALYDPESRSVFTGDTFGLSYRATDTANGAFVVPTTTPTQFDPEQLTSSVERIASLAPDAAYLTHFGRVADVPRLARSLKAQIAHFVAIAEARSGSEEPERCIREDLAALLERGLREHGVDASPTRIEEVFGEDLTLNAQGLLCWLDRRARSG